MTDLFQEPEDATPLAPDEREGLRLTWVTTRADLNAAEQDNIDKGAAWAYRARKPDLMSVEFVLQLHNGRHARMMADLVLRRLGEPSLSWGGGSLTDINDLRRAYVEALRRADREDYDALIAFSRS